MSNFICDKCGTYIQEGYGGHYVTECEHYPLEKMTTNTDTSWPSFLVCVGCGKIPEETPDFLICDCGRVAMRMEWANNKELCVELCREREAHRKTREELAEACEIADHALRLAEIDYENDKFGVVTSLRAELNAIK